MPTLDDQILLALDVYNPNAQTGTSGWAPILQDSNDSGFFARAYSKGGEIVISFRGWDNGDPNDLNDIILAYVFGDAFSQLAFAQNFVDTIVSMNPNAPISIVGHSLGGGIAGAMAIRNNLPAATFAAIANVHATIDSLDGDTFLDDPYGEPTMDLPGLPHLQHLTPADIADSSLVTNHVLFGDVANYNAVTNTGTDHIGVENFLLADVLNPTSGDDLSRFGQWTGDFSLLSPWADILGLTAFVEHSSFSVGLHSMGMHALALKYGDFLAQLELRAPGAMLQLANDYLATDRNGGGSNSLPYGVIDQVMQSELSQPDGDPVLKHLLSDLGDIANAHPESGLLQTPDYFVAFLQIAIQHAAIQVLDPDNQQTKDGVLSRIGDMVVADLRSGEGTPWTNAITPLGEELLEDKFDVDVLGHFTSQTVELQDRLEFKDAFRTMDYILIDAIKADTTGDLQGDPGDEPSKDLIIGGKFMDILRGGEDNDILYGAKGFNQLIGEAGDDMFIGSRGQNQFIVGDGNDIIIGADGDDRLYVPGSIAGLTASPSAGEILVPLLGGVLYEEGPVPLDVFDTDGDGEVEYQFNRDTTKPHIEGDDSTALFKFNPEFHVEFERAGRDLVITIDPDGPNGPEFHSVTVRDYEPGDLGIFLFDPFVFFPSDPGEDERWYDAVQFLTNDGRLDQHLPPPAKTSAQPSDPADDPANHPDPIPTIVATPDPEPIVGTQGDDVIDADGGDDQIQALGGDDIIDGGNGADTIDGGAGSDMVTYLSSPQPVEVDLTYGTGLGGFALGDDLQDIENLSGSLFDDILTGDGGANILVGRDGDDALKGRGGQDSLTGGLGNDLLDGGSGSDSYFIAAGEGSDIIDEYGNSADNDRLYLAEHVESDLTGVARALDNPNDLLLSFGTGQTVRVDDHFRASNYGIEEIVFADGTLWDRAEIDSRAEFVGTDLDDAIVGTTKADRLLGGTGDDLLNAKGGSDTYVVYRGDGADTIDEYGSSGDTDMVVLADRLSRAIERLERPAASPNDLLITFNDGADTILIDDHFRSKNYGIETIQFANFEQWDRSEIDARAWFIGTDADEIIRGTTHEDRFDAGGGDDILKGRYGGDTYVFGVGYGNDTIDEYGRRAETDVVQFKDLRPGDVYFSHSQTNANDLVLTILSSGDTLTIDDHFKNEIYGIEAVQFSDGSSWGRAEIEANIATVSPPGQGQIVSGTPADEHFRQVFGEQTYLFGNDSGHDIISDIGSDLEVDRLVLSGLGPAHVTLTRSIDNPLSLMVTSKVADASVLVAGQFDDVPIWWKTQFDDFGIELLEFGDGTVLDESAIVAHTRWQGTDGADAFAVTSGDDLVAGGPGNDRITGAGGNDTFIFAPGDGHDIITDFSPDGPDGDRIQLEGFSGLNPADLLASATLLDGHTVLTLGLGDTITLSGIQPGQLDEQDILIA